MSGLAGYCGPLGSEIFRVGESEQSDLYVMYFFPQWYRVYRPTNSWILWLQDRMPGMPDATRLAAEAEAADQAVKDDLGKLVQRTIQDCAMLSRH